MRRKTPLARLSLPPDEDRTRFDSSYYRAVARVAALLLTHPQGITVGQEPEQVEATLDRLTAHGEVLAVGDAYTIAETVVGLFGAKAFDNLVANVYNVRLSDGRGVAPHWNKGDRP